MTGECNVARDLMPLCIDGAASKESEAYVGAHVSECEACRAYYDGMKASLPKRAAAQSAKEQAAFSRTAEKLCRRRWFRKALIAVLVLALLIGGIAVGRFVYENASRRVKAYECDTTVVQLSDGRIMTIVNNGKNMLYGAYAGRDGAGMTGQIDIWRYRFGHGEYRTIVYAVIWDDADTLQSIRLNDATIWRQGDALQAASKELEEWVNAREELDRRRREIEKAHALEMVQNEDYGQNYQLTGEEDAELNDLEQAVATAYDNVPEWPKGSMVSSPQVIYAE